MVLRFHNLASRNLGSFDSSVFSLQWKELKPTRHLSSEIFWKEKINTNTKKKKKKDISNLKTRLAQKGLATKEVRNYNLPDSFNAKKSPHKWELQEYPILGARMNTYKKNTEQWTTVSRLCLPLIVGAKSVMVLEIKLLILVTYRFKSIFLIESPVLYLATHKELFHSHRSVVFIFFSEQTQSW